MVNMDSKVFLPSNEEDNVKDLIRLISVGFQVSSGTNSFIDVEGVIEPDLFEDTIGIGAIKEVFNIILVVGV